MPSLHKQRLLHDIHEISSKPYPNIIFHSHEDDINKACLVLTPPGLRQIHLTVNFPLKYPLEPPRIRIQTTFIHPNVFGNYICASILNTKEGYTPAYTLKGVAIQILSFFNSDTIQQDFGMVHDLAMYRDLNAVSADAPPVDLFRCDKCGFPNVATMPPIASSSRSNGVGTVGGHTTNLQQLAVSTSPQQVEPVLPATMTVGSVAAFLSSTGHSSMATLNELPPEVLIRICDFLESEELLSFMRSWDKIGGAQGLVTEYGLIRKRELQCFVLKEGFNTAKLGVGVRVYGGG